MTLRRVVLPEAETELLAPLNGYEDHSYGLGRGLLAVVEATMSESADRAALDAVCAVESSALPAGALAAQAAIASV